MASGQKYNYAEVSHKSFLFYEANRSGPLPADKRIDWRFDSGMTDAVLGGYYDGNAFTRTFYILYDEK